MNAAYGRNNKIDNKTIELIAARVAQFNERQSNASDSSDAMDIHIQALSEVFDVDKSDIEKIARDVVHQQQERQSFKDKLYDGVIKYSKEVIVSIIVMTAVSLLLLGRSGIQQTQNLAPPLPITAVNTNTNKYLTQSYFASTLASLTPIRTRMMEYFYENGKFPQTLSDIGLSRNEMSSGRGIEDLILVNEGVILVKLDETVGNEFVIAMFPTETMQGLNIEWKCQTNVKDHNVQFCETINADKFLAEFN